MFSKYFEIKTKEACFQERIDELIKKLENKKILAFGFDEFLFLNNRFDIMSKLNVVAFYDRNNEMRSSFLSKNVIHYQELNTLDYDTILIANCDSKEIEKYVSCDLGIENKEIITIFQEEIIDEQKNLDYLYQFKFDKTLPKLLKKLKDKTVVLYGTGAFLELIQKYFDISSLNVIGVSDRKFSVHEKDEKCLGYNVLSPNEIKNVKPDYVLVSTKYYVNIIEDLYYNTLHGTKIKVKPILKKGFITLLKEIWK